jgi:chloramphenicol 3-O phosphotransferase
MTGKIILINGTSSSGKTTLARELQRIWPSPLLYLGIDMVIGMLPFAYTGEGGCATQGFAMRIGADERGPTAHLEIGPAGQKLNRHLAELASRLAGDGFDLVIDHVILDDPTLGELVEELPADRTWFIGVHCEGAVADAREQARDDRFAGTARTQRPLVHAGNRFYDLEIDTSAVEAASLAVKIADLVNGAGSPSSFRHLRRVM